MEGQIHHHLGVAAEVIQLFHRGAEVEAAIQEHLWHRLAAAAVEETPRQVAGEEADQPLHPAEVGVEESCLLAAEVGEEPYPPAAGAEEQSCRLGEGEAAA